jgi:glycosyltransferase involved in cell wall biosynthesis
VISFIVPAYNEEKYLGAALESIHSAMRAIGEPYEIVVANDASTDATAAVAEAGGARVVSVDHRQIAKTRNSGAKAATGDVFIFVDADSQVNEALLRAALAALRSGAVGGGAGVVWDGTAPSWAQAMIQAALFIMRVMRWAAGSFVFCTRAAFEAVGGFDEAHFAGEEIYLSIALKRQGRFVILGEAVTTSPRKFASRGFWETFWIGTRLAWRGLRGVRRREDAAFWYDGKR